MSKLIKHNVFYVDIKDLVKLYEGREDIDYKHLGINLIGRHSLCRYMFSEYKIGSGHATLMVNPDSFDIKRSKVVDTLLKDIIIPSFQTGKSINSIKSYVSICDKFIAYCNENKMDFHEDKIIARKALESFIFHIKQRLRSGSIGASYAYSLSKEIIKFLRLLHDDTRGEISAGLTNIIPNADYKLVATKKPKDEDIQYVFKFYHSVFSELADFVIEQKKYPFSFVANDVKYNIIPSTNWKTKHNTFNGDSFKIELVAKIKHRYKDAYSAATARNKLLKKLKQNNTRFDTDERLFLASVALRAYYLHFLALTGMNDSTAATLKWNDEYEIEKTSHSFKNIKCRAGNKPVEFKLQSKSIKDFKKFLELRKYLLGGNDFEYLFFKNSRDNACIGPEQKMGAFSSSINTYFAQTVNPALPKITSRQYRLHKTHHNINKYGFIEAAQLAQSKVSTLLGHYTGEDEESTGEQLTKYFDSLNKHIIFNKEDGEDIVVGQCKSPNNPSSNIDTGTIQTDCKNKEGCLFCDHYGCHADEIDVKKLYSLLYVINESRYIAKNEEHFVVTYGVTIDRVDNILEQIEARTGFEINKVKVDVFENENLHPYWEHKLNSLYDMGVLK